MIRPVDHALIIREVEDERRRRDADTLAQVVTRRERFRRSLAINSRRPGLRGWVAREFWAWRIRRAEREIATRHGAGKD